MTTRTKPQGRIAFSIQIETIIVVVILLWAAATRLPLLGLTSLNAEEASQALSAWNLASGGGAHLPGTVQSPLIMISAAAAFWLGGPSDALARWLPALSGLLLVASPLLFKKEMGRIPTLLTMIWLAVSPIGVAASREFSGITLSMLAFVILIWLVFRLLSDISQAVLIVLGVTLAVLLLSDSGVLPLILAACIAAGFVMLTDDEDQLTWAAITRWLSDLPGQTTVISFAMAFILLGTGFFMAPGGIGAAIEQIGASFTGLIINPDRGLYSGFILTIYEPFLLIFGIFGTWLASLSEDPRRRFFAGWSVAGMIIVLLYRGALPVHALWASVPLAFSSGIGLGDLFAKRTEAPGWVLSIQSITTATLLIMTAAALLIHVRQPHTLDLGEQLPGLPLDLILAVIWIMILTVVTFTIAISWDAAVAWQGLGTGTLILAVMLAAGSGMRTAYFEAGLPYQVIYGPRASGELRLMMQEIETLSWAASGTANEAAITIVSEDPDVLAWSLRDFPNIAFEDYVPPQTDAALLVVDYGWNTLPDIPLLAEAYVGQDFVILRNWNTNTLLTREFIRWMAYRDAPTPAEARRVIVWLRDDIYQLQQQSAAQ